LTLLTASTPLLIGISSRSDPAAKQTHQFRPHKEKTLVSTSFGKINLGLFVDQKSLLVYPLLNVEDLTTRTVRQINKLNLYRSFGGCIVRPCAYFCSYFFLRPSNDLVRNPVKIMGLVTLRAV
jgi:hypothetical protein